MQNNKYIFFKKGKVWDRQTNDYCNILLKNGEMISSYVIFSDIPYIQYIIYIPIYIYII